MLPTIKKLFSKKAVLVRYKTTEIARGSERIVIQGEASFIEAYISQKELEEIFGGYLRSRGPTAKEDYLGVWGLREGGRFRRLLRERGAEFDVRELSTPLSPKIMATR